MTHPLFDQLANGDMLTSSDNESSQNSIEKLNLLEEDEDDESEWQEPARTVFDRDATPPFKQGIEEESKGGDFRNTRNFMI